MVIEKPIGIKVVPEAGVVTREGLERYWVKFMNTYGPNRTIGLDFTALFDGTPSPSTASLMEFLPLYLVNTFLKCQKCGSCCRPVSRWRGKGVALVKGEMLSLRQYCHITKNNGRYLLKYPCQLLKNKKCSLYKIRPLDCRLSPLSINKDNKTGKLNHGITTACPAAKELYVAVELFLQELGLYLQECQRVAKQKFSIEDLEMVELKFDHNKVSTEDMAYMKKMAWLSAPDLKGIDNNHQTQLQKGKEISEVSDEEERHLEDLKKEYMRYLEHEEERSSSARRLGLKSCQRCGYCCMFMTCVPRPDEIAPIAEFFGLTSTEFVQKYMVIDKFVESNYILRFAKEGQEDITGKHFPEERWFDRGYCIFFDKDSKACKIHPVRPQDAREWKCWDAKSGHKYSKAACNAWGKGDIYKFIPEFQSSD